MTQADLSQEAFERFDPELEEQVVKFLATLVNNKFQCKFESMFQRKLNEVEILQTKAKESEELLLTLHNLENEYQEEQKRQNQLIKELRNDLKEFSKNKDKKRLVKVEKKLLSQKENTDRILKESNVVINEMLNHLDKIEYMSNKTTLKLELLDKLMFNVPD